MQPKRPSNYDRMRDRMEQEFVKYDQKEMIRKFSLEHDEEYLYLPFVGREYRVNRRNGRVEWAACLELWGMFPAGFPCFPFCR